MPEQQEFNSQKQLFDKQQQQAKSTKSAQNYRKETNIYRDLQRFLLIIMSTTVRQTTTSQEHKITSKLQTRNKYLSWFTTVLVNNNEPATFFSCATRICFFGASGLRRRTAFSVSKFTCISTFRIRPVLQTQKRLSHSESPHERHLETEKVCSR